jgi:molybdopterin-biosynthesis enzyme MoeA-like protein
MLEWVLDAKLRHMHNAEPPVEFSLRAYGSGGEGDLLELMEATLKEFVGIKLASLPFRGNEVRERHIEFGIKGPRALAGPAFSWFRERLLARGDIKVEDLRAP